MATITGYTAAKEDELHGDQIIDGDVSGDNLILTKRNGGTIDAGNVRGATGAPGADGADAAPGDVNPTAGTTPIRDASGRVKGFTPASSDDLTTKSYVDAADSAISAAKADLALVTGTEIGNAVNLNSLVATGLYYQSSDAEAAAGSNYPTPVAGTLQVIANAAGTLITQTYNAFADAGMAIYRRTYSASTWSAWGRFDAHVAAMPSAVTTTSNGTETSAGTETRDAVLGNYTFTALAGHLYRVVLENAGGVCTVVNDQFGVRIRNGGASTPTASSTMIANTRLACWNNSIALPLYLSGKFSPGAGTQTLSVFCIRLAGTGTMHMWSGDFARALSVIDLGT